jgi:hypothetical protein
MGEAGKDNQTEPIGASLYQEKRSPASLQGYLLNSIFIRHSPSP